MPKWQYILPWIAVSSRNFSSGAPFLAGSVPFSRKIRLLIAPAIFFALYNSFPQGNTS
jgi:hypothetical protein